MRFRVEPISGAAALARLRPAASLAWRPSPKMNVIRAPRLVDGGATVSKDATAALLQDIVAPEPEPTVAMCPDVILAGRRFLVMENRWAVWNRMEGDALRRPEPGLDELFEVDAAGQIFLNHDPSRLDTFRGRYILLHWDAASMYHHWMFECVPRLIRALRTPDLNDAKFVLPLDRPSFVDQTLDLLAVPPERRAFFDPSRLAQFEELSLIPIPVFEREACSVSALHDLRSALLDAVPKEPLAEQRKVFFSRRDAKKSERILLNEDELISALSERGFNCVESGELPVADQVRIARDADIIACVHGSAGANLVFSSPQAKVLHIFPDCVHYFVSHGIGTAVAGCDYGYVFGPSFQRKLRHHNNPWMISPDRVLQALKQFSGS